jgi:segregation and condensation protein B
MSELEAKIEALLFVYGEPLAFKRLAEILGITPAEAEEVVKSLGEKLKNESGLKIIFEGGRVQLVTKPEYGSLVEKLVREETREELSPASLETLAIVSYLGPVARSTIEYIRGVNSSFILRSLLIRGLVERMSDSKRTNVYLYKPSFDLLKFFGIGAVEELPEFGKFRELDKMFESNEKTQS